jgi:hypothetical protein
MRLDKLSKSNNLTLVTLGLGWLTQSEAWGQCADEVELLNPLHYGYDPPRDICRFITLFVLAAVLVFPLRKGKNYKPRQLFLELFLLGTVPVLVHFTMAFCVNCWLSP